MTNKERIFRVCAVMAFIAVAEIAVIQKDNSVTGQTSSFTIGGFTITAGATRSVNSDDILTRQQADALYQPKTAVPTPSPIPVITITQATYGGNVGAPAGNATSSVATACNGKAPCTYIVDVTILGDPAIGKAKNFVVNWSCGGVAHTPITIAPEAGSPPHSLTLVCP